jgi:hypothetical protein
MKEHSEKKQFGYDICWHNDKKCSFSIDLGYFVSENLIRLKFIIIDFKCDYGDTQNKCFNYWAL